MTITTPSSPAIYARISSDPSHTKKKVERQIKLMHRRAAELGWPDPAEYVDDDRASKAGVEREDFNRLISDFAHGVRDGLLVWKADRYSREPEHTTLLKTYNIPTSTEYRLYEPWRSEDLYALRQEAANAERETLRLSERLLVQREEAAELGERHGQRPFGWQPNPGEYETRLVNGKPELRLKDADKINPAEAAVVREGLQAILEGRSITSLTKEWNARGIKTARGRIWASSSVRGVLERWSNAGVRQYHGQPLLDQPPFCEPISDLETVKAVRALLANNPRNNTETRARKHMLTGILRCECGGLMKAQSIGSYAHRYPEQRQEDGHLVPTHYKCRGAGCGRSVLYADANEAVARYVARTLVMKRSGHFLPEGTRNSMSVLTSKLADIEQRRQKILAAELGSDDQLDLLVKIKKERERLQAQLDAYAVSSKLAKLVDDLTKFSYTDDQGHHRVSFEKATQAFGKIRDRFRALDLRQQKDLLLALATYTLGEGFSEPDVSGKRRKLKAAERIKISPL